MNDGDFPVPEMLVDHFIRVPIRWVPQLEDDMKNPFYMLEWGFLTDPEPDMIVENKQ